MRNKRTPLAHLLAWLLAAFLLASSSASAQKEPPNKKPPGPDAKEKPPEITDPLILTLLEEADKQTATPERLVQSVKLLIDLKQVLLAKPYVTRLAAANLNEDQLASLGRKFGTAVFMKMSLEKELNPKAIQFSDKVLDATRRAARDPERLAGLIEKLKDPSARVRGVATSELALGGDASVNALIAVLVDENRGGEHQNVRSALVGLRSHSIGPLIGALETTNQSLKAQVIAVLGGLKAHEALPYLLAPAVSKRNDRVGRMARTLLTRWLGAVPSAAQAESLLAKQARAFYGGKRPKLPDLAGNIELWHWDAGKRQAVRYLYAADDASMAVALRLAREWRQLAPRSREARRIYLGSLLQLATYQNGLDKPLPKEASSSAADLFGVAAIKDLLVASMDDGHIAAATAAARILGDIGSEDLLRRKSGHPAFLVRAAANADRRLRFAAVEAIIKLKPTQPFAWSENVPRALAYFANTTGALKTLVVDANVQEARRMAGFLAELGYDAEIAFTARGMLKRVVASPDFAFVLLNTELPNTNSDLLVQQLRNGRRTAGLPIGLIHVGGELRVVERLVRKYSRTAPFVRTRLVKDMAFQVNLLLKTAGRDFVTLAERVNQARQSLIWMAELASEKDSLYDFRPYEESLLPALYVPELGSHAAAVLAHLKTPFAQRTLVNVASTNRLPLKIRSSAADAFDQNYQKHGVLLTRKEIQRQYDRYNGSEFLDKETQTVLAKILDTIESPLKQSPVEKNPIKKQVKIDKKTDVGEKAKIAPEKKR